MQQDAVSSGTNGGSRGPVVEHTDSVGQLIDRIEYFFLIFFFLFHDTDNSDTFVSCRSS